MADKQHTDSLQQEVLEAQLRTQKAILAREEASLEETVESLADRKRKKKVAAETNAQRQRQFDLDRANLRKMQRGCEHRSGGFAGENSMLEGDGPSVLHVTIMPDGKTEFMQCTRCGLKLYGRQRTPQEEAKMEAAASAVEKKNPTGYMNDRTWLAWDDYKWWKELKPEHRKHGIKKSVMRGPTFTFERVENGVGVPFIPELR